MASDASRRNLTLSSSRKRKERDGHDVKEPIELKIDPSSNRLLAGYLAHEFLTRGTLFGKKFDPFRTDSQKLKPAVATGANRTGSSDARADQGADGFKPNVYADVASLLMKDGAHVPGIVNPTQLANWLRM